MALQSEGSPLVAGSTPAAGVAAHENTVAVRALSQFRLPGQDDPQPGDVLQVSHALAAELVMYGRVERVQATEDPPAEEKPAKRKGTHHAQ